jgi:hypothetical protein
MFSTAPSLASGDALGPFSKPAKTLLTYDFALHYPSSLAAVTSPSHFVRSYHRVLGKRENELATLDPAKNQFFEYLSTYLVIASFLAREGKDVEVQRTYHRFSSNGQLRAAGGAGIDLVVTYRTIDKRKRKSKQIYVAAYNMHHQ